MRLAQKKWKKIFDIIFPPLCIDCKAKTDFLFCPSCSPFFELIDPLQRCQYCFEPICRCRPGWKLKKAAALDFNRSTSLFLHHVKQGRFINTAAAFIVMQLASMPWHWPDLVAPVRSGLYSHNFFLSKSVGKMLNRPFKRRFSSSSLIIGKTILIVSDCLDPDNIQKEAEILLDGGPKHIYAMTLCKPS